MNKTDKLANKIIFNPEEEELFHRLEEDDLLGTWIISPHATPLEKAKYNICQTITRYQIRNNLSEKEIAKRLELDESTTGKLLRCWIKDFDLNKLTNYLVKIHTPELVNSKGEVSSAPLFIELVGGEKIIPNKKVLEEIEKLKILSDLRKLMNEWKEIYIRDREVNPSNVDQVIEGAKEIVNCFEKLEKMCNPIQESSDVGLLEWINQNKPQYKSIIFRGIALQRIKGFNSELLMTRVDNEKTKGHLFVIFERTNNLNEVQEQFLLLEKLSCLVIESTNENGDCDILGLFNVLWKVAIYSSLPFTYIFVPEGEENLARKLIFDTFGGLTAEELRKIHFSKRGKSGKEHSLGFKTDQDTTSPNFFYTDPSYQEVVIRK